MLNEEKKNRVEDHILAYHGQEIKEWEQDQTTFLETRATRHILESLPLHNCIVVTGSSGCGKSSNIHHTALHLRDSFGYEIIPVLTGPADILNYYNQNKKQVFVVDDICGKETLNMQTLKTWRDCSDKMEKMFKATEIDVASKNDKIVSKVSSPKLLLSCRLHIYKESQFQRITLFTKKECNLLSPELCLQVAERMFMLQKYLPEDIINDVQQFTENVDYFPLLCKLSKEKTSEEVRKLFTSPLKSIKKNINNIIDENKEQFCALTLCILFDEGFNTGWLKLKSAPEIKKDKIKDIVNEFEIDLSKENHRNSLTAGFSTLNGTYLKLRVTKYRMIHDKLYKMAAVVCGQHLTECFIKHAHPEFIQNHFIFKSLTEIQEKDDSIVLLKDQEEDYFERLLCDLNKRVITSTFHNYQLISYTFRDKLISFLRREDDIKTVLEKLDIEGCKIMKNDYLQYPYYTTLLIESVTTGYIDIVQFLIVNVKCNVNKTNSKDSFPLYEASERGHSAIVKLLLENNAVISQCNKYAMSPLYVACREGHRDTVELLLQNNADVSQCNEREESPLYVACEGGHKDLIELLLENKADVNQCEYNGKSPLYIACKKGNTDTVELLLKNKADFNKSKCNGESPLFVACKKGHTDTVLLLLRNNADVNQCNNNGQSPLYAACRRSKENTDLVELLLQNKADVSQCNDEKESPLFVACEKGHTDTVKLLLQNNANIFRNDMEGWSPLLVACEEGHTDTVKLLLQNNADVNKCEETGETPLFVACRSGAIDTVELLLQQNADVNKCTENEVSPLEVVCILNDTDIVELLLQNNADVSHGSMDGNSLLYRASCSGRTKIVELLLRNNADVSQCNEDGQSPLYVACQRGHPDIVELLLRNNADVSQCNEDGQSPLYVACQRGHPDIVEMLLQKKADVSQCDNQGDSPLHAVVLMDNFISMEDEIEEFSERYIETVKILLAWKADVEMHNMGGETPLHLALISGFEELVNLFKEHLQLKASHLK